MVHLDLMEVTTSVLERVLAPSLRSKSSQSETWSAEDFDCKISTKERVYICVVEELGCFKTFHSDHCRYASFIIIKVHTLC